MDTPLFHITERLGAVVSVSSQSRIQFRLFFPTVSPAIETRITSIRVAGTFQTEIGQTAWSFESGPELTAETTTDGIFWTCLLDKDLSDNFYEYKYYVTFDDPNISPRIVTDPYARYSGSEDQNSGFVIGGQQTLTLDWFDGRKPPSDLVIYELHIGDFTVNLDLQRTRSPLDVITDKLDYIKGLGFNAIEFEPWTAWQDKQYDWGYTPFQYFAVEYMYANDPQDAIEKISWLKRLISQCHDRGLHVIMDGVYDHAHTDFPYPNFYADPKTCPYTDKAFGEDGHWGKDLDFGNDCTQAFIRDVCLYWISEFKIDGIRFDYTVGFSVNNSNRGAPKLLADIEAYMQSEGQANFSTTIEHLRLDAAPRATDWHADSFWDGGMRDKCISHLSSGILDPQYLSILNDSRFLGANTARATLFLSNHDHASVAWQATLRPSGASWARTQPHAIALLTSCGVPLIPMGQEFGFVVFIPEIDLPDDKRVRSRPLVWTVAETTSGKELIELYKTLIKIRGEHPALRSRNFYPPAWEEWMKDLDPSTECGLDVANSVIVYRRWSEENGQVSDRIYVVLNFSDASRDVDVMFEEGGTWLNLLPVFDEEFTSSVSNVVDLNRKYTVRVSSNWGAIFAKASA